MTWAKLSREIVVEDVRSIFATLIGGLAVADEGGRGLSEAEVSASLVARIAAGDKAAESEMYVRYARAVIFVLRQRGADQSHAEDLCQETFITAYEKLRPREGGENADGIRKSQSLAAFLQGIAIRKLHGDRRKAERQDTWADTDAIERAVTNVDGPLDGVAVEQIRQTVKIALEDLEVERDRDILASVYLRDEERASIQQRLEIDADHFNRVLYRAKARLSKKVEQLLENGGTNVTDLREFAAERH